MESVNHLREPDLMGAINYRLCTGVPAKQMHIQKYFDLKVINIFQPLIEMMTKNIIKLVVPLIRLYIVGLGSHE